MDYFIHLYLDEVSYGTPRSVASGSSAVIGSGNPPHAPRHPPVAGDQTAITFQPSHSITSSARARTAGGTVRPSTLAVLRLTTSSNFVGCWTGRSAGLAPLRIFPT